MTDRTQHARIPEQSPTETMMRALQDFGDDFDRVVVVALHKDGINCRLLSNCRSEPEMNGMLWGALEFQNNLADDND